MNFYAVMGVEPYATMEDINAAYRRLAPLCHPRQTNRIYYLSEFPIKNISKQEYWIILNKAYQVLSVPQYRAQYDLGDFRLPRVANTKDFNKTYDNFFRAQRTIGIQQATIEMQTRPFVQVKNVPLVITLDELWRGTRKEVSFSKTIVQGGMHYVTMQAITVEIMPGMQPGSTITVALGGDCVEGVCGPVIFTLVQQPHDRFFQVGHDLHTNVTVPLRVALLGGPVCVIGIDGRNLSFVVAEPFPAMGPLVKQLDGEGMPLPFSNMRGKLIVHVFADHSRAVPDAFREDLRNILEHMESLSL